MMTIREFIKICGDGDLAKVKEITQQGYDINHQTPTGLTALFCAAHCGRYKTCQLLLEYGANPNIPIHNGKTAHDYIKIDQIIKPLLVI